jgi:hypothetical protein
MAESRTYTPSQEEAMEKATMELAEDLKDQFRDRDQLYADIDAVLFQFTDPIPDAYRKTAISEIADGTGYRHQCDRSAERNPMNVSFKPIGFGDVYQQNSTLRKSSSRRAGSDRSKRPADHCCASSCGAWWSKAKAS